MQIRDDGGRVLDAEFSVVQNGDHDLLVTIESRGGGRHEDYNEGLDIILARLRDRFGVVTDALIASRKTAALPPEARRLDIDGHPFPIRLEWVADLRQFRRALSGAQARVAREPGARGTGNATRRVEMAVSLPQPVSAHVLQSYLAEGKRPARYWAFLANQYDVESALRDRDEDIWTTEDKPVAVGDRVVIWKARGTGDKRGVVALGEVLTDPAPLTYQRDAYWPESHKDRQPHPRTAVRVRYTRPPGLPLWLGDPGNAFLEDLAVARARGGAIFTLTEAHWAQVATAAGARGGADEAILTEAENAIRPSRATQGRLSDPRVRQAIEQHAMERAKQFFGNSWTVENVSTLESYDLLCRKGERELRVEVKGTTGAGSAVLLTKNEVAHARQRYPDIALFVTSGIRVDTTGDQPVASGGVDLILHPWRIDDFPLVPVAYECRLGAAAPTGGGLEGV